MGPYGEFCHYRPRVLCPLLFFQRRYSDLVWLVVTKVFLCLMVSLPLCLLFYSRGIYYYCNVTKGALPPSICLPIFSCGKWYVLPLAFVMLLLDATEPSWGEHKHVRDCACIHFLLWASRCMECVPHRRVHLLQGTGACLRGLLCHMRTCGGVRVRV